MRGNHQCLRRRNGRRQDGLFGRKTELWDIRSCLEIDPPFGFASRLHVVLRQPPANLAGNTANHMVGVGIVVRGSPENVDPYASFFELFGPAFECAVDHMPQQAGVPPAVPEDRAGENAMDQLFWRSEREALKLLEIGQ